MYVEMYRAVFICGFICKTAFLMEQSMRTEWRI